MRHSLPRGPLLLLLAGLALLAPARAENTPARADWMREARFGVMTHFLYDWIAGREGRAAMSPEKWNEIVNGFDVAACAAQLRSVGARYYLISLGQNSGYYVSPNAAYDRIVGITPSRLSRRDLVAFVQRSDTPPSECLID